MVTRLDVAHGRRRRAIQGAATRQIRRAWVEAATVAEDRFVADAVGIARAATARTVSEVDAYMATALTVQGAAATPRGLDPAAYRRPVDPDVQWRRPFVQLRTKLAGGMELPQAAAFASQYAAAMLATDLQLASRSASRDWMVADGRPQAWQRVLGDGGASGENCGLCIVASTQRYWIEDLAPIHINCSCEVKPLLDVDTRRQVIRSADEFPPDVLEQLQTEQGTYLERNDLRRVRIDVDRLQMPAVAQHGELGPYLYDARHAAPTLAAA